MDAPPEVIDVAEVPAPEPTVEVEQAEPAPGVALVTPQPVAAVDLPMLPGDNELRGLAQMANTFANSNLVPEPLKGKPADVLLVMLTARDLGLSVTVALRECHPIDGRVTVSPKLKMAIVRQRGLGRIWGDPDNDINHHTWHAARADDPGTVYTVRYTWADAQRAGLVMTACTPEEHSDTCKTGSQYGASAQQKRKACKQNWRTYPGQMLQWRCVGYLMDQAFGEVGTGLYSPDELGGVTDEDGHVIDVLEVGGVDGLEGRGGGVAKSTAEDLAPEADREAIKAKILALPDPAIETLREQWSRRNADDIPTLWPLPRLPQRQVKAAHALVDGFVKRAEKGEWGPWSNPMAAALSVEEAAQVAQDAPAAAPGPEAAPDAGAVDPGDVVGPEPVVGEALDAIIAHVQGMVLLDVEYALNVEGVNVTGKENTDRARLAQFYAQTGWVPPSDAPEAIAQERRAQEADEEG